MKIEKHSSSNFGLQVKQSDFTLFPSSVPFYSLGLLVGYGGEGAIRHGVPITLVVPHPHPSKFSLSTHHLYANKLFLL